MKIDKKIFFTYCLFYLSLFFVKDNKAYLFLHFLISALLFVNKNSLKEILFSNLLLSLLFERGLRGWMVAVVPQYIGFDSGYSFYFGISIKILIAFLLLSMYFKDFVWNQKNSNYSKIIILLFLILSALSTILHNSNFISLLGLVRIIYLVALFFICSNLLKKENYQKLFINIVLVWLLFSSFLGTVQFLKQGLIGSYFEDSLAISRYGYTTNESDFLFRVSGFTGHPTFFGSWLSTLFSLNIAYYLREKKNSSYTRIIMIISLFLSLIAIFATYSRSAWLSLFIALFFYLYYFYKKGILPELIQKSKYLIIFTVFILFINAGYFLERIDSFSNIWSLGTGKGRIQLLEESSFMIKNNLFFGVGLNKFTSEMVQNNVSGASRYFLYPVHNTLLLFATELGLLSTIIFIYLVIYIVSKYYKNFKNTNSLLLLTPVFVFLFNSQFHTLFNQDPSFDLFIIILAYLDAKS